MPFVNGTVSHGILLRSSERISGTSVASVKQVILSVEPARRYSAVERVTQLLGKDKRSGWERIVDDRKAMGIPKRKNGRPKHTLHICKHCHAHLETS